MGRRFIPRFWISCCVALGLAGAGAPCLAADADKASPALVQAYPISAVVAQVKRELIAAQSAPGAGVQLVLNKVDIRLLVTRQADVSGGVSFGVPAAGFSIGTQAGRHTQATSTVSLELAPPPASDALGAVETKGLGLAEMIVHVRRELLKGLADEPRLLPRQVVMSIGFELSTTGGPDGEVKFLIGAVRAGERVEAGNSSTITLTFGAKPRR